MGEIRGKLFFVLVAFLSFPAYAGPEQEPPSLRQAHDPQLQRLLDRGIQVLGLTEAVKQHNLAVALVDLGRSNQPRMAQVNGDEMMYAASLPKIGILLAAFVEIQRGRLTLNSALRNLLTDMIRVSSNDAATRVMNLVGKQRVNEILAGPQFRLYDAGMNGGLWVGKEYGKNPAFQRDPLHNISHGATAFQVARFYYLLETGRLVNPLLTSRMKEAMSHPAIQHKFVKGLTGRDVELYRKSGSWHQWHADSALVVTPEGKYILVALAQDARGGEWMSKLAPVIHDMLFPSVLANHDPRPPASQN